MLAAYPILLLLSLDYSNFGFRRPFLFNFNLCLAIVLAQFISMHSFIISNPANEKLGVPHQIVLFFAVVMFLALLFNRRKRGYLLILASFAMSIFTLNYSYKAVDGTSYSFFVDVASFNKSLCSMDLTNLMAEFESMKLKVPADHPMRSKVFSDQIINDSNDVLYEVSLINKAIRTGALAAQGVMVDEDLYYSRGAGSSLKRNFNRPQKVLVPLWHSSYTGIYKVGEREHHYYLKGGKFDDLVIYCDDVPSFEVEAARRKALEAFRKINNIPEKK